MFKRMGPQPELAGDSLRGLESNRLRCIPGRRRGRKVRFLVNGYRVETVK